MIYQAFMLAARLVSMGVMAQPEAVSVAIDAREAVLAEGPLFSGPDAELRSVLLLVTWVGKETAGRKILGDCNASGHCASVGRMQIRDEWFGREPLKSLGLDRATLLADGALQVRAGYRLMLWLRDHCGSVVGGLNAYASGHCKGTSSSQAKVRNRCVLSGACG